MKYKFYVFITTQLFMIAPQCNAMERSEEIKKIMTLKHVSDPRKAQYITQDSIAIVNCYSCKIVNITTNTTIKLPLKYGSPIHCAGIQKNSNKIAFSSQICIAKTEPVDNQLYGIIIQNIIDIYDTNSGTLLHTITAKNAPLSPIFSSSDDTVVLGYKDVPHDTIQKYNYKENFYTEHPFTNLACFATHPTKNQLCVACNFQKPTIYNMDDFSIVKTMPLSAFMTTDMVYTFCEYSPDGSVIATGTDPFLYIWNLRADKSSMLPIEENEKIQKIAFHPNNIVLALLSKPSVQHTLRQKHLKQSANHQSSRTIIRYWDILKHKPIKEMSPLKGIGFDISFSPDGKQIAVTLHNRCVIYPVPPEVINPEEVS